MRRFHYILLIIRVDFFGKAYIIDPLDKDPEEYNSMIYMLDM
jgi:hypothetical protein